MLCTNGRTNKIHPTVDEYTTTFEEIKVPTKGRNKVSPVSEISSPIEEVRSKSNLPLLPCDKVNSSINEPIGTVSDQDVSNDIAVIKVKEAKNRQSNNLNSNGSMNMIIFQSQAKVNDICPKQHDDGERLLEKKERLADVKVNGFVFMEDESECESTSQLLSRNKETDIDCHSVGSIESEYASYSSSRPHDIGYEDNEAYEKSFGKGDGLISTKTMDQMALGGVHGNREEGSHLAWRENAETQGDVHRDGKSAKKNVKEVINLTSFAGEEDYLSSASNQYGPDFAGRSATAETTFSVTSSTSPKEGSRLLMSDGGSTPVATSSAATASFNTNNGECEYDNTALNVIEETQPVLPLSTIGGSLGLEVGESNWVCNVVQKIAIEHRENQWSTQLLQMGGDEKGTWQTEITQIQKNEETQNDWKSKVRDISNEEELHTMWTTHIAKQGQNLETPVEWSSIFKDIKKVDESKNRWTTTVSKIKKHMSTRNEWTSTFNAIGSRRSNRNEWRSKIQKTSLKSKFSDWTSKIAKTKRRSDWDTWKCRLENIFINSTDKQTDWACTLRTMSKLNQDSDKWQTSFKDISTEEEKNHWDVKCSEISDKQNLRENWSSKFMDIAKCDPVDETWVVEVGRAPNALSLQTDWTSSFNKIEPHGDNRIWNTEWYDIAPKDPKLECWDTSIPVTDLKGIERDEWETNVKGISLEENGDSSWYMTDNVLEIQNSAALQD